MEFLADAARAIHVHVVPIQHIRPGRKDRASNEANIGERRAEIAPKWCSLGIILTVWITGLPSIKSYILMITGCLSPHTGPK